MNGYVPPVPAAGVPENVAVSFPLSVNVTPDGSVPVSDNVQLGTPVDVTPKVPAWPTVKVVTARLVNGHAGVGHVSALVISGALIVGAEALSVARLSVTREAGILVFVLFEARAMRHLAPCSRCPDGARRAVRGDGRWRPGVCRAGHLRGRARCRQRRLHLA